MKKKALFILFAISAHFALAAGTDTGIVLAAPVDFSYSYSYSKHGESVETYILRVKAAKSKSNQIKRSDSESSITNKTGTTTASAGASSRAQMIATTGPMGVKGSASAEAEAHAGIEYGSTEKVETTEQGSKEHHSDSTREDEEGQETTTQRKSTDPTLIVSVRMMNRTKNDTFRFDASNTTITIRIDGYGDLPIRCSSKSFLLSPSGEQCAYFEKKISESVILNTLDENTENLTAVITPRFNDGDLSLINECDKSNAIVNWKDVPQINVRVEFGQIGEYGSIPCRRIRGDEIPLTYREVLEAVNTFLHNNRREMPKRYFEFGQDGGLLYVGGKVGGDIIGKVSNPGIVIVDVGKTKYFSVSDDVLKRNVENDSVFRKVPLCQVASECLDTTQLKALYKALLESEGVRDTKEGRNVIALLSRDCADNAIDMLLSCAEKGVESAKNDLVKSYLSEEVLTPNQSKRIFDLIEKRNVRIDDKLDEKQFGAAVVRPEWEEFLSLMQRQNVRLPESSIYIATERGQSKALKWLLRKWPELDKNYARTGICAVDLAIRNNDQNCFGSLWDARADAYGRRSYLIVAAEYASTNILSSIFNTDKDCDVNEVDSKTRLTPLMLAARRGGFAAVKMLIGKGADVQKVKESDTFWSSPEKTGRGAKKDAEYFARDEGFNEVATLLHSYSEIVNIKKSSFSKRGYPQGVTSQKVRGWVLSGVSPNEFLGSAIGRGGDWSIYTWTIVQRDDALLEFLIDKGADVNDKTNPAPLNGYTALMLAAEKGNTNLLTKLIAKGLSVAAKDNRGWTALMYAVSTGKIAAMELLMENAADINIVDEKTGKTALCMAIERRNSDAVNKLLLPKSNRNLRNLTIKSDWRDLNFYQFAAMHLKDRALLESVFSDDKAHNAGEDGVTPLMAAAYAGNLEAVKFLVETKKEDVKARDKSAWFGEGKSALDYAQKQGKVEVVNYIKSLEVAEEGKK